MLDMRATAASDAALRKRFERAKARLMAQAVEAGIVLPASSK